MLYEKPEMEVLNLPTEDIVCTSDKVFQDPANPDIDGDGYSDLNNEIW